MAPVNLLRRHPITARIVLYGTALLVGLPVAFCRLQTSAIRQPKAPVRPPYVQLTIEVDGLHLRAWLATGSKNRPAVVIVHGLSDSLESYADVGDTLHARGHTVLLLDLRGHGGSQGRVTTLGAREREDVRAAMEHLRRESLADRGLILMGWSMGAAAVLRAAADRDDVRAVIVESPYDTYRETIARHASVIYHLPAWVPLIPISIQFAEWWGGFDADEVDAVAAARRIRAPLLAIADGDDALMPEEVVRRIYAAHPGPKELWVAPGMPHVSARLDADYWPHVMRFLESQGL
jgi:pimeloyl-ACP methyl ester carboxylesterase